MFKVLLFAVTLVFLVTTIKFAYLASISMRDPGVLVAAGNRPPASEPQQTIVAPSTTSTTTTQAPGIAPKNRTTATSVTTPSGTARPLAPESTQSPPVTSTTFDPDADPDDVTYSGNDEPAAGATPNTTLTNNPVTLPPSVGPPPDKTNPTNANKPQLTNTGSGDGAYSSTPAELSVLFYSIFIVYVSFVKLAYHNIHFIKYNLTEQGILMIFGIIWQLVARQISSDYNSFPRFNSRIFFYLFLPSTVLESASMLSNKWLFFNLLPILTHSIIGTVLYASSMGFTIFALSRSKIFTSNWMDQLTQTGGGGGLGPAGAPSRASSMMSQLQIEMLAAGGGGGSTPSIATSSNLDFGLDVLQNDYSNLTLADCLVVGTILSSIDSAPMLNVFKQYQVNEKLYYLVLGENLLNQAVVITIFNLLIEFFETKRLTVMKCYIAIMQFFANLIGAVLIGVVLALFALISVRLIKRFQVPHALSSYHNQCQAMVETLLILKLAYLTYTLSNLAGTSSILGLATFGILNDQYIKHNLNLRSQLAFRQVILGMRTLGFSLVYPLLGMLLVDTAMSTTTTQFTTSGAPMETLLLLQAGPTKQKGSLFDRLALSSDTSASGTPQRAPPSQTTNLSWNFKFLSIVILLTIVYRFLIVIALGIMGNVLTCGQLKIKFKEQVLMAYGGFKGPLSIALVHSLMEHENHKERIARNKHLFKYTILISIFISAVLAGTFIRPLVARIQSTLIGRTSTSLGDSTSSTIVFEQINYKLTEYVSHGLNSILGHTRSPYDKFLEFNETHIKPWLVRNDSNTNWLSVFYDNLILDETLNANCFYIVTEDPTTMRVLKLKLEDDSRSPGATSWRRRRTSSVSFLPAISEHGDARPANPRASGSQHVSLVQPHLKMAKTPGMPRAPTVPKDREILKEFVLFNLRLENSRRRRLQKRASSIVSHNHEQEEQQQQQQQRRRRRQRRPQASDRQQPAPTSSTRHFIIDDSSATSSDLPEESSLDRASRQVHLNRMEANLGSIDNNNNNKLDAPMPSTSSVHHVNQGPMQHMENIARSQRPTSRRSGANDDQDLPASTAATAAAQFPSIETRPTRGHHRRETRKAPGNSRPATKHRRLHPS